jgi:hypothetical protein
MEITNEIRIQGVRPELDRRLLLERSSPLLHRSLRIMRSEIVLKMPQRGPSALGIAACVALALCFAAPSRARACGTPEGIWIVTLGGTLTSSWIAFGVMDMNAAVSGRPLSSEAATVEMLFPGMVALLTGASLVDSSQYSGLAATALVAGSWFTLHGGYALIAGGGDRPTDVPARVPAAHAPRPQSGQISVALNPDPRSPRAALSVTF